LTVSTYGATHASPATGKKERGTITIGIYNYAHAEPGLLLKAQRTAASILWKAEVETVWHDCTTDDASRSSTACAALDDPTHLTLRIAPDAMSNRWRQEHGDALGFAVVGGQFCCYASVLYDRVTKLNEEKRLDLASLLGTVMAHELGHLLLNDTSHANAGLMRANWSCEELSAISRGWLLFSDAERKRIQNGVIARHQVASSVTAELSSLDLDTRSRANQGLEEGLPSAASQRANRRQRAEMRCGHRRA